MRETLDKGIENLHLFNNVFQSCKNNIKFRDMKIIIRHL